MERLGRAYEALGMPNEALATYRALIALHPGHPWVPELIVRAQARIDEIQQGHPGETVSAEEKAKIERVFADLERRYGHEEAAPPAGVPEKIDGYLSTKKYFAAGLALKKTGMAGAALWAFSKAATEREDGMRPRDPAPAMETASSYETLGMWHRAAAQHQANIVAYARENPAVGRLSQARIDDIMQNHRTDTISPAEKSALRKTFAEMNERYGSDLDPEAAP